MKTLIWKELRENLKWTPLPALVVLLVVLIDKPEEPMFYGTDAFFFCLTATVFGAALGFLQIFFEAHGDKRSLLLHRPLGRSGMFLAKVIAGLGLYLLALGIPFVCLEIWLATPGKVPAPYHWQTSLPWLADILSGVVYYFAGMLVAQRDARWYGSRCLPLAAAFCCSYLVWTLPEFSQALVAIGIIGSCVGVAAWASFSAGGAYPPQPRVARAALALTFLAGLLIVSMLGKQRIGEWFDSGSEYRYTVTPQGRVLFQHVKAGVGEIERADLDGKAVPVNTPAHSAPLSWLGWPNFWSYRNSDRFYVQCLNDTRPGHERWYYDHVRGRLLGYHGYYRHFLGSFGPDGFTPADGQPERRQPEQRFQGELRYLSNPFKALKTEFLVFGDRVYALDFARRTIRTLFVPPAGETLGMVSRWRDELDNKRTGLVAGTDKAVHFLTEAGALVVSVPRVHDHVKYLPLLAGPFEVPERYAVCYTTWFTWASILEPAEFRNLPGHVHEYDVAGHEVAAQTLPPFPYPPVSYAQALFGLATPATEAALLVELSAHLRAEARLEGGVHKSTLLHSLENIKYYVPGTARDAVAPTGLLPGYGALILLSAASCALGCFTLARRHAFSRARRIGWALVGFFFGWAGLVLMLAVQEWPARIACRKCARLRVVTRDTCEHCGALHAPPTADGTEVFESAESVGHVELAAMS